MKLRMGTIRGGKRGWEQCEKNGVVPLAPSSLALHCNLYPTYPRQQNPCSSKAGQLPKCAIVHTEVYLHAAKLGLQLKVARSQKHWKQFPSDIQDK